MSAAREAAFEGPGKVRSVMRKAPKGGQLHLANERINRIIAMVRALAENRAQLFTLFALGNLFLA